MKSPGKLADMYTKCRNATYILNDKQEVLTILDSRETHEEDLGSPRSILTSFHVLCHVTLFVSHESTTVHPFLKGVNLRQKLT